MPFFIVEQYELHVSRYLVEADSASVAVESMPEEGELQDGLDYISSAEEYSRPLRALQGIKIPGVRDVYETDEFGRPLVK